MRRNEAVDKVLVMYVRQGVADLGEDCHNQFQRQLLMLQQSSFSSSLV